jgi:phage/plasmid primase-like uncharacterized protein
MNSSGGGQMHHHNNIDSMAKQATNRYHNYHNVIHAFSQKLQAAGIYLAEPVIADGKYHRFSVAGRKGKPGWYVLAQDANGHYFGAAGIYGSHECKVNFSTVGHTQDTNNTLHTVKASRESLRSQQNHITREIAKLLPMLKTVGETEYTKQKLITTQHAKVYYGTGYIEALIDYHTKNVKSYKLHRGNNKFIAIPLFDLTTGHITTLQIIYDLNTACSFLNQKGRSVSIEFTKSNHKQFLKNGQKKGSSFIIGKELTQASVICICEGFATAASVYEAGDGRWISVAAFDVNNIAPVTNVIRTLYPNTTIIICADNDQYKARNIGKEVAEKVAAKYGCKVLLPQFDSGVR